MGLIDLILSGSTELTRPLVSLGKEFMIGVALGVIVWALLVPLVPTLRDKSHGYTTFLASMLALYAVTEHLSGNGAMAVLTASLLLGNASTIVPRLIPGAQAQVFVAAELPRIMQGQMNFLIKSFFFVLIGLMFPLSPRLIFLGGIAALFLLVFRIPAVIVSVRGLGLSRKQFWLLVIAIPRGLAAGVLSMIPLSRGVPGVESLSGAVFSMVVFSILIFSVAFSLVNKMPADG
jgi:Na+:H+ antiporter